VQHVGTGRATRLEKRREGVFKGWSTVLITALGSWGKHREGDPKGWSTLLITALGSWGKEREGDPKGWSTVLIIALSSWGKEREGDPIKGWSTVLITALSSWGKEREGDLKGWSTVLITALGSWEKAVPRGHTLSCFKKACVRFQFTLPEELRVRKMPRSWAMLLVVVKKPPCRAYHIHQSYTLSGGPMFPEGG
jgi:hypothetical protein